MCRMYGYNVDRAVFFFTSHPAQLVSIDMLLMDLSVRTLHPRTIPDSPRYSVNYGFEDHMCAPKRRRSQELKKRSGQNKNTMCLVSRPLPDYLQFLCEILPFINAMIENE